MQKKQILIAPLNWGLGHATRCIPIIKALINNNFEPIVASDGYALNLLKKEFPNLVFILLPSYPVSYSKKRWFFKWKLLLLFPKMLKTIHAEKIVIEKIIRDFEICGIISDNRFGVYSKKIPSVFITHQLRVLSGNTTWFSTKMHQKFIKNFSVCWVPDTTQAINLSGNLSAIEAANFPIKKIGILSRFEKKEVALIYDILILLSGPEPQRTLLENKLLKEMQGFPGKVVLVRGKVAKVQEKQVSGNMLIYNFMTSEALEKTINSSKLIISRSGYTTVMDLAKLEKKAFFIPTPGQFEQEYLAKRLEQMGIAPFATQACFCMEKLKSVSNYNGFRNFDCNTDFEELFRLF